MIKSIEHWNKSEKYITLLKTLLLPSIAESDITQHDESPCHISFEKSYFLPDDNITETDFFDESWKLGCITESQRTCRCFEFIVQRNGRTFRMKPFLYSSIPCRVEIAVRANGNYTKYWLWLLISIKMNK